MPRKAGSQNVERYPWALMGLAGLVLALGAAFGVQRIYFVATVVLTVVFVAFFGRHLVFALTALGGAKTDLDLPPVDAGFRPRVSVMVACKNEESVVDDLVTKLLALEYAPDRLELIVVDDGSADRTGELLDAWAAAHAQLKVVHRPPGAGGGKSGALNEALLIASGEVIVIFDADHQPMKDVLWRLVRHFADPTVSAAQGRCEILNPQDSPLTKLVAIDFYAGYLVNEYGRQAVYRLPAYGGANCAVRASSLRALGGWNPNSVTEDTDLTLQLLLSGQRVRYDVTAVDREEGVVSPRHFWRQRYRWARGHQQVWRDYRWRVWRSKHLTLTEKVELTMFLLVYHVPVFAAAGFILLGFWLAGVVQPSTSLAAYLLWTLLFLGPLLELGSGLLIGRVPRRWIWPLPMFFPLFFVVIALCTKAWVDGLLGRPYAWVKTPRAMDDVAQEAPA